MTRLSVAPSALGRPRRCRQVVCMPSGIVCSAAQLCSLLEYRLASRKTGVLPRVSALTPSRCLWGRGAAAGAACGGPRRAAPTRVQGTHRCPACRALRWWWGGRDSLALCTTKRRLCSRPRLGCRLDSERSDGLSFTTCSRGPRRRRVRVAGRLHTSCHVGKTGGSRQEAALARTGEALQGRVLYRDADLLVLDKPAGLAVQGGDGARVWFPLVHLRFPSLSGHAW